MTNPRVAVTPTRVGDKPKRNYRSAGYAKIERIS